MDTGTAELFLYELWTVAPYDREESRVPTVSATLWPFCILSASESACVVLEMVPYLYGVGVGMGVWF